MQRKIEKTDEGVKVNGLTFFEFQKNLQGKKVFDNKKGETVPKFVLFWAGYNPDHIAKTFSVIRYKN